MKTLNDSIVHYKTQLKEGEVQQVYKALFDFMGALKAHLTKVWSGGFSLGNISPGYMDYTYFPFSDEYLCTQKLRFGIVLNHEEVAFELWLMGRNAQVQKEYWNLLKDTKWNKHQATMPQYSVLEATLVDNPDFDNLDMLTQIIEKEAFRLVEEITHYIQETKG